MFLKEDVSFKVLPLLSRCFSDTSGYFALFRDHLTDINIFLLEKEGSD
jgi:hypothetical protein